MEEHKSIKKIFRINKERISIVALFFVFIQILNNSIFPIIFRSLNTPLQISLYLSFIIILIKAFPNIKFQEKSILLIIGTATSLIVNEIDAKYMSGTRWILWILLLASIGPITSSRDLLKLRLKILDYFLKAFIIVTLLSFVYYLLGFPQLGRGNFGGIINQSMTLGPIAAISGIYSFYIYLTSTKKIKRLFLIISLISVLIVIISASRLAFAGYIAGMIFLFAKPFKYRIIYTIIIISMGVVVYSRLEEGSDKVEKSFDKGLIEKGTTNSREILWTDRINEFKSSPIFGVGFAAQNDYITESDGGGMGGKVEPGSGYLMILSMTGVWGLALFLWYFYFLFNSRRFWIEIFNDETYKLSIFSFFAVHFIGEGYVYASGALMSSFFWLMVGVTFPYLNVKKRKLKIVDKTKI